MISIVSFLVNQEVSGFVISLQQNCTDSFEELRPNTLQFSVFGDVAARMKLKS